MKIKAKSNNYYKVNCWGELLLIPKTLQSPQAFQHNAQLLPR